MVIAMAGKLKDKRLELDRVEGGKVYFVGYPDGVSLSRVEFGEEEIDRLDKRGLLKDWVVSRKYAGRYILKSDKLDKSSSKRKKYW